MSTDQSNNISTVRQHMLDQLKALREAPVGASLDAEIRRAKGVSELSQTLINSARAEIEYLEAVGGKGSAFLQPPKVTVEAGTTPGIVSVTQHRLLG